MHCHISLINVLTSVAVAVAVANAAPRPPRRQLPVCLSVCLSTGGDSDFERCTMVGVDVATSFLNMRIGVSGCRISNLEVL